MLKKAYLSYNQWCQIVENKQRYVHLKSQMCLKRQKSQNI